MINIQIFFKQMSNKITHKIIQLKKKFYTLINCHDKMLRQTRVPR